jgi:hypothetical protein
VLLGLKVIAGDKDILQAVTLTLVPPAAATLVQGKDSVHTVLMQNGRDLLGMM